MNNIKITSKDIIWGVIGKILNLGSNIIMLPILIYFLKDNEMGLWYILMSINSLVSLLDFGFSPSISRSIAYCWGGAEGLLASGPPNKYSNRINYRLIGIVISTSKNIYLIISIIATFFISTIGTAYILFIASDIKNILLIWSVFCVSILLNIYFGYYGALLTGSGKVAEANRAISIARIIQFLVLVVFLFSGFGLIGAVLSYFFYSLSYRFFNKFYFQNISELKGKIHVNNVTKKEKRLMLKILWPNAGKDGVVSIANFLTQQSTTFICSFFYSLAEVGYYNVAWQLANGVASVSSILWNIILPEIQESFARSDYNRAKIKLSTSLTVFMGLYIFFTASLFTIGIPMLKLVKPEYYINKKLLLLIIFYLFFFTRHSIYASFISASNRLPYVIPYICSGICSVILITLVAILFPELGIYGMVIMQIIVQLCYNNWKWPYVVHKELNTNSFDILKTGMNVMYKRLYNRYE